MSPQRTLKLKIVLLLILTILKLDLYFQVLSEQVHHHCLHVPSDATAIPVGDKKNPACSDTKIVLIVHADRK